MRRAIAAFCLAFLSAGIANAQDCTEGIPKTMTWSELHKCLEGMIKLRNEMNVIRGQIDDIKKRVDRIEHLIEARFSYSFQFKGYEFANGMKPINRFYFFAAPDHDVRMSIFMWREARSDNAQFLLDLFVNGIPIRPVIRDTRESIPIPPKYLDNNVLTEVNDESIRIPGLHSIELKPAQKFQMEAKDFFEASGIIHVTRKPK